MDRERAANNVFELQTIFGKSFATYGTALGSLRENNIIEHDPDTDIGIFSDDFDWDMVSEAVRWGFNIVAVFGARHHGLEIAFKKGGIKTDLMVFYNKDGKVINSLWLNGCCDINKDEIIHEYEKEMFEIQLGQLGDKTIRTLGENYINHVYGDNWKVPVKKWDWRNDHKCKKTG